MANVGDRVFLSGRIVGFMPHGGGEIAVDLRLGNGERRTVGIGMPEIVMGVGADCADGANLLTTEVLPSRMLDSECFLAGIVDDVSGERHSVRIPGTVRAPIRVDCSEAAFSSMERIATTLAEERVVFERRITGAEVARMLATRIGLPDAETLETVMREFRESGEFDILHRRIWGTVAEFVHDAARHGESPRP